MFKDFGRRTLAFVLAMATVFTLLPVLPFASLLPEVTQEQTVQAHAKTVNVLDGLISVTDTSGNASLSNGVVTTTIKGSLFSKKTNTVTIANESQSKATLKFDYTASSYNSFTVAGASGSASGTYSALLDPGASVVLTIQSKSGLSDLTATLKLSNFSLTAAAASSNITFQYDSTLGSVSVEDTAVANGASASFTADGKTIKATPVSGATFLGWVYEDGKVLSREPGYHFAPSGDTTIKAIFVNSSSPAYFFAGSTYLLSDLNAAANAAAAASQKTVILMNSATLSAGNYTIPSGVTLLIPYNDTHTLCTTAPTIATADGFETLPDISAYRTLTMAAGAHITVNGAISVSGTQHAGGRYCGNTRGPLGYINMKTGSTITINSGAFLYAWGYIIGDGTVTGKSGATVYESFQITDWRGGSVTSKIAQDTQGVFPMCQYFVQNIEVPLTLEAGAKEFAFMSVNISLVGVQDSAVPFIGDSNSGAMFRVAEGSVTKKYDGTTDRLIVSANGQVSIEPLKMSMKLGLIGETELDSAKFNLPITNNMTVVAEAGTMSINQNVAVLPGAQVIVKKDATCVLGSGKSIIVYDSQVWGNYVGSTNLKFKTLPHAPGRTYTRTEADLVDAYIQIDGTMDASKGYLYTTSGGANIVSTAGGTVIMRPGTAAHTYQMTQGDDDVTYVEVPVTSAMLKNSDGNFVATSVSEGTFTYDTTAGKWIKDPCAHVYEESIAKQPGCTTEGTKVFTCKDAACGHSYTQAIAATGHTPGDEATCTTAQTCTKCAEELTPAKGHTPGPDATCTTTQTCTVCDAELNGVKPHSYSSVVTEPTCTESGFAIYTCDNCSDQYTQETAALGHNMVHQAEQEATCTQPGVSAGSVCSRCGYTEDRGAIPELGHNWVESTREEATCTTEGKIVYLCDRENCDVENASKVETLAAKGHSCTQVAEKDATCTEVGWDAYEYCVRCDYTTYSERPIKEHTYTAVVTAPTCTVAGYTTHTCSGCSHSYVDSQVSPVGHDMAPATCTNPSTCKNGCGFTEGTSLGHKIVIDEEVQALCEDSGLTEGSHCAVCGEVLVHQQVIPALGHKIQYFDAKKPTYTGVGWKAYEKCSRCAHSTYVEIPALGLPTIWYYDVFMANLTLLEELAENYVAQHPGKDPAALVIKYIRTGVDRYNSGSWGMMAGEEDADFARYVFEVEDAFNSVAQSESEMLMVSGLKNIKHFYLPNGDYVDFGHMFGMMDIAYHNRFSVNHADVGGWAGDLVDLLSLTDQFGVSGTLEEMIADISANYLLKTEFQGTPLEGSFGVTDMYADLDGFYIIDRLSKVQYESGMLCDLFREYFTENLTTQYRISYFLENRLNGITLRGDIRTAVYNAYTGNKVIATLEGTRNFTSDDLLTLKKACCYAFADYLCRVAGDYVESTENNYYDVFSSESSTLAPGITQKIQFATSADGKQMAYYLATADLTRDDVRIYANYNNNDPEAGWAMQRVLDQANAAQKKYGDPSSSNYIPNYNVIASINGAGYNMETGEPGGVLVMNGVEYHPVNGNGFFGILKDGTPVIGTTEEYNTIYQGQVQEAIAGFGAVLIKDGQIQVAKSDNHRSDRASRTAIGITKTGKVVFMVLDGRQEPFSCGGSMEEIAQIMLEAGCVHAINLDGGGSSTYVAKQEGEDTLSVINRPSDGSARSVSTSLILVSTAPNSKAFDHAILDAKTNYLTVGSSLQIKAEGVSVTGNSAIIPEGATWAVSDTRWGTITEDGVFTALRNGDVDVYLMLGDEVIGSVTLHVVIPNNIYFTKSNIDAVYGEKVELPVKALYDGKEVTVRAEDLIFTLEAPTAGTIDGLVFVGNEASKVRSTKVTVALADNTAVTASTSLSLYYQGETSFDFEQAVGGDRQLAWDRVVSNATTQDAITYSIVDIDKDMVTSYIVAMDMTQIPVPQRLEDLIYMLPGSDVEGASAWTFLLQLAQRVSVLTEVKLALYFDVNFHVDYSNVTLVNDYFELKAVDFDETTNALTLTLKWKKQTQAVDPNVANPICILSGIKLTPKENAQWSEKGSLTAVHGGKVSYTIYLRATSLYTFAQKPENQATYGLLPFVNPDDRSETGASFGDTYKEFQDTYTLVRVLKNGWVNEEGGFAYYVDGEKLTGIQLVDGYYYDFGVNGINIGQTKYSGLFWDASVGAYRYAMIGTLTSGWKLIDNQWYHFWQENCCASVGTYYWGDVDYTFDETGRLTSGVWKQMDGGTRYYYGPTYYYKTWATVDGDQYYFDPDGYRCEGYCIVKDSWTNPNQMYHFTQDGALVEKMTSTGLLDTGDKLYYLIDGIAQYGLYEIDGYYYYFNSTFAAVTGLYYVNQTNGLMAQDEYLFDENGRMIVPAEPEPEPEVKNGLVAEDDGIYYYVDGVKTYAGLIEIDGDYYYINSKCKAVTGIYYAYKNNDLMPQSDYRFGEDGKMIMEDGLHTIRGERYYYKDGKLNYAGLIKLDGNYYYINSKFKAVTGTYYAYKNNGLMPQADYEFASDGRMLVNGLVEEDGKLYYYENGTLTYAGLIKIDGYYYYINSKFQAVTGVYYVNKTNGIMAQSDHQFGDDGKMVLNGLVEENGGLYYYKDGKLFYAGLIEINGDFYYINSKYKAVTGTYYVNKSNGLMPQAEYQFADDGKMILPGTPMPDPEPAPDPGTEPKNGIVTENGQMYYYVNGVKTHAGLIEVDGDYYYINSKYKVVTGIYYVYNTNGLLPQAEYIFADDGKMIGPVIYS